MNNVTAPKGAGKGIPRPKLNTETKPAYTPPRPLRVGDIVTIKTTTILAQIIVIQGNAVILAPLIDTVSDEAKNPDDRFSWEADDLRLASTPPLPLNANQRVLAEATEADYEYVRCEARDHQKVTPPQRLDHQRRLQLVANAFGQFEWLWGRLVDSAPNEPSIASGSAMDTVPIVNLYVLMRAAKEQLMAVVCGLHNQTAHEDVERLTLSDVNQAKGFTRIEPERCIDQNDRRVEIGDLITDPTNDLGGIVVAITPDAVLFKMVDGNFEGALVRQCISTPGVFAEGGQTNV